MQFTRAVAFALFVAGALLPPAAASNAPLQTDEPRSIEVLARRFTFEPAQIEATEGERLRIVVRSGDGFHGFGIKKFDVSKEIARGETVTIDFTPDVAGEFPILCTGFCGDGHGEMKGLLIVKARETGQP